MLTREGHTEERTPAPAGSVSRILDFEEACSIGVAPWRIESLDDPAANVPPPPAKIPDKSHGNSKNEDFEEQLAHAAERHRRELQDATDRARRDAEANFARKLESEVEPWLRRLATSIEDIATVKSRYLAESEEKIVRLAIAIAQRILHREIQIDATALVGLLKAAVNKSELREVQRIVLNPLDLEAVQPHLERLNLPPRIEITAERSLERGALLIESTMGVLDASILSQLDEVERGFIDMLGKRGGSG